MTLVQGHDTSLDQDNNCVNYYPKFKARMKKLWPGYDLIRQTDGLMDRMIPIYPTSFCLTGKRWGL